MGLGRICFMQTFTKYVILIDKFVVINLFLHFQKNVLLD